MKVEQLMTRKVLTVPHDTQIGRVFADMKLAEVRHLPVVNHDAVLIGIVSRGDLQRVPRHDEQLLIRDVMHSTVHTVRADADAADAAALLVDKKIGALPVVDDRMRLVGIITETDFLNVAFQALRGLPLRGRGEPS